MKNMNVKTKRNALACAMALVYSLCLAATNAHGSEEFNFWNIYCQKIEVNDFAIMKVRQDGMLMSEMMEIAGDDKAFQGMVIAAFEQPRHHSPDLKERAAENFAADWASICFEAASDMGN